MLGVEELKLLGRKVTAAGLSPLHDEVSAVQAFQQLQTVGELMRFNGMVNFYNPFIPHKSLIMAWHFPAVAGKKGKEPISWDTLTEQAFANMKSALTTTLSMTQCQHPPHFLCQ